MSKTNRYVINMASGGAGYIVPMLLNLLFTPIIVKNLGSEAYGLQTLVNVIIGFLMVADMGLDIPVTKLLSELIAKKDHQGITRLLSSTFQLYLIIAVVGMLAIGGMSYWLAHNVFRISDQLINEALVVFILSGVGFFGGIFSLWGKSIFNGLQRYEIANGISIVSNLTSTVIGITLVIAGYGVVPYVFIRVLFSVISGGVYLALSKRLLPDFKITLGIELSIWIMLKAQLAYGFILRISGILFSRMDQVLIGSWIGVTAVGVYAIPYMVTSSLIALIASVTHFIFPLASELHSTNRIDELRSLFLRASGFVASTSSIFFIPLILYGDKFLTLWVGSKIGYEGKNVLLLLAIATFSSSLSNVVINSFVSGIGQLRIYAIWATGRSILMAIGCFILINPYGIIGAGMAMLFTCFADYFYFIYVIRKYVKMRVRIVLVKAYIKPFVLGVTLGVFAYHTRNLIDGWLLLFTLCTLFVALYIVFGFIIGIYGELEKRIVTGVWVGVRNYLKR